MSIRDRREGRKYKLYKRMRYKYDPYKTHQPCPIWEQFTLPSSFCLILLSLFLFFTSSSPRVTTADLTRTIAIPESTSALRFVHPLPLFSFFFSPSSLSPHHTFISTSSSLTLSPLLPLLRGSYPPVTIKNMNSGQIPSTVP